MTMMGCGYGATMGCGLGVFGMWGFWVFGLLLLVGLALLVVLAVRALGGAIGGPRSSSVQSGAPSRKWARDILDERYARGEIGDEEYRQRLRIMSEDT